jgi:hypothetical protein
LKIIINLENSVLGFYNAHYFKGMKQIQDICNYDNNNLVRTCVQLDANPRRIDIGDGSSYFPKVFTINYKLSLIR